MLTDYDVVLKQINITSSSQERRVDGYIRCKGTAIALVNDDEEVEFTFEYKGISCEDANIIETYLKKRANTIYREKMLKKQTTLFDFVKQHMKD